MSTRYSWGLSAGGISSLETFELVSQKGAIKFLFMLETMRKYSSKGNSREIGQSRINCILKKASLDFSGITGKSYKVELVIVSSE